jgi:hypothetical protein
VFTNLETYLVIANYGKQEVSVRTNRSVAVADDISGKARKDWSIQAGSLRILRLDTDET